jgi:hypothetical protein
VTQRDVELVFVVVNWEESAVSSVEDDINPDNALLLFEFVEAIIRFAVLKYLNVCYAMSVADPAVSQLLSHRKTNVLRKMLKQPRSISSTCT